MQWVESRKERLGRHVDAAESNMTTHFVPGGRACVQYLRKQSGLHRCVGEWDPCCFAKG